MTGRAMQQPFLLVENQSEFNGISNISNIKGDNLSQFMGSGEADILIDGMPVADQNFGGDSSPVNGAVSGRSNLS